MNIVENDELYHYGVLGMKWGVRRAARKTAQNEKLRKKALNYDIRSDKMNRKSEKIHATEDLERSNRAAKKAADYRIRSEKLQKKALNEASEFRRSKLEKKASKYDYKSTKKQLEANRISKSAGYGSKAMKYSIKSDKLARKAAKTRMEIANNEAYIAKMNRKMSDVPDKEVQSGRVFVDDVLSRSDSDE